jgi:hypothetical protein
VLRNTDFVRLRPGGFGFGVILVGEVYFELIRTEDLSIGIVSKNNQR